MIVSPAVQALLQGVEIRIQPGRLA